MIAAAAKKEEGRPGESGPQINTQCREEHCERKRNAGEPGAQVGKFSALVSSRPMGKRVWLEGGVLRKEVRSPQKVFTHVPVEVASIEDLADAFGQANSQTVFVTGLHPSEEGVQIRRDKAEFGLDHGAGVMFLDNDTHPGGDQFASLYAKGCPALAGASYVHSPSSGAYIYDADGLEVAGAKGQHYAVPVLDAADIPRAIEGLHERCILAGLGVAAISASGLVRIKSPVDTAMATVQQPLFHGVDAIGGLVQRKKPHIKAHQGRAFLFDTRLIKSLSASERTQLQAIKDDLRQQVEQEASQIRERWLADREAEVSFANAVSLGEARAKLEKTLHLSAGSGANIDLWAGMKIQFDKLGLVDVADVLADPDRYHGQTCDDPMEPSYKPGTQVAICYSKSKDGTPHPHPGIHSFAHGARNVYHLKRDLRHIVTDLEAAEWAHVVRLAVGQGVDSSTDEGLRGAADSILADPTDLAGFRILSMPDGMKATEFVIDGFLPNGVTVIAGEPGAGKTTNLVPMAASVAHLSPAEWGVYSKRRRVVVWLSEHPEQVFDTMEALLSLDGSASREEFAQWFKVVPTRRSSPEELAQLIGEVNHRFSQKNERGVQSYPLIVWDTAAATLDVNDENGNTDVSKAIALAKQMLNGGALWVITHTPKNSKGATDVSQMSARGASAYEGDANCTAYLFNGGDGRRVLALGKIRFKPEFTEIHFDTASLTQTIVDDFDGQEIVKTVVSGLPFPGSKEGRQQERKDFNRAAQWDAMLQAATEAAKVGELLSGNELLSRSTVTIQRTSGTALINQMIGQGVLARVSIPPEVRKALRLNNRKNEAVLPASADAQAVFAKAMGGTLIPAFGNQRPDFVKSEGSEV